MHIVGRGMKSKTNGNGSNKSDYGCYDDVCDVAGIMTCDRLLQFGGNVFPFMRNHVREIVIVHDESGLDEVRREIFDKILVDADGQEVTRDIIEMLADMNCGVMVFFSEDEEFRMKLKEHFMTSYYPANAWVSMSSVGGCVVTDAKGAPLVQSTPVEPKDIEQLKEKFNG